MQNEIDVAIFYYTIGENKKAKVKLEKILESRKDSKEAWHALAEILWSEKDFKSALKSAEKAYELDNDDLHINTTLSRIWVQIGDQEKAEKFNAQARMLGWKDELKKDQNL